MKHKLRILFDTTAFEKKHGCKPNKEGCWMFMDKKNKRIFQTDPAEDARTSFSTAKSELRDMLERSGEYDECDEEIVFEVLPDPCPRRRSSCSDCD